MKDYEWSNRGTSFANRIHVTSDPLQTRPAHFVKELMNNYLKEARLTFLFVHWQQNNVIPFLGNKKVLLKFDQCFQYEIVSRRICFQNYDEHAALNQHLIHITKWTIFKRKIKLEFGPCAGLEQATYNGCVGVMCKAWQIIFKIISTISGNNWMRLQPGIITRKKNIVFTNTEIGYAMKTATPMLFFLYLKNSCEFCTGSKLSGDGALIHSGEDSAC